MCFTIYLFYCLIRLTDCSQKAADFYQAVVGITWNTTHNCALDLISGLPPQLRLALPYVILQP